MKSRDVFFSPEAEADLASLRGWITTVAGRGVADQYFERLENFCLGLSHASERGTARNDIIDGLRISAFERSVTIAFAVSEDRVIILRLFYRGADWEHADEFQVE